MRKKKRNKTDPLQGVRIDVVNPASVRMWSERFRCTSADLLSAVEAVGADAILVRGYVARRKLARRTESEMQDDDAGDDSSD